MPIYYNHRICSCTGRSITADLTPKYWTLPLEEEIIHHKHILYGLDDVDDIAVPVEGPIDAIRGGKGFVSTFGVQVTDEQKCMLLPIDHVIFVKDNDLAGEKFTQCAYELSALGHKNVEVVTLGGTAKDIGAMPRDEILDVRKELGLG
jgi:DNA primase